MAFENVAGRALMAACSAVLVSIMAGCATTPPAAPREEVEKLDFQTGPGPYAYACDAPGGQFNESNVAVAGDSLHASGVMRFQSLRSHPEWAASATVAFSGPTRHHRGFGLQAVIMPDAPDTMQFAITGRGDAQERTVFATIPFINAEMPFEVDFDRTGNLVVTVAGVASRLAVDFVEPTRLSLFCSTAVVQFSRVTVAASRGAHGMQALHAVTLR